MEVLMYKALQTVKDKRARQECVQGISESRGEAPTVALSLYGVSWEPTGCPMAEGCDPVGKRNVTIEEVREALRKACADAKARDGEVQLAAAASVEAASAHKKQPGTGMQLQGASVRTAIKKATPARKVRTEWQYA
jgi:hypothetical protein